MAHRLLKQIWDTMVSAGKRLVCGLALLTLTGLIAGGIVAWGEAVFWGEVLRPGEQIEPGLISGFVGEPAEPAELMVVFIESRCPTCRRLVEELRTLCREPGSAVEWHLVVPGPDPTLQGVPLWLRVHQDSSGRLHDAFRVTVVPAAFYLGERGRLKESRSGLAAAGWITHLLVEETTGGRDDE